MRYFVCISFFFLNSISLDANENTKLFSIQTEMGNTSLVKKQNSLVFSNQFQENKKRPSPLFARFRNKQKDTKRFTASILAFPFPFGIVGLHRIYLGCPPYVPVVYIGTFGGVFGALPLIDFFVLVFDKNTELYTNNNHVFMWIK